VKPLNSTLIQVYGPTTAKTSLILDAAHDEVTPEDLW